MAYETKPNTAKVFVENGLFSKQGVESLIEQNKPILKVKVNIDGVDKEIALYFDVVWENDKPTKELKITRTGNKMLSGKITDPWVATEQVAQQSPEFDDDIPF